MATAEAPANSLADPSLKAALQDLRRTDNFTNWFYLAAVYLYLAAVIGAAVWFFESRDGFGLSWWWNVPVTLAAIKADKFFASFPLVRMSRLSVMPVNDDEWERIVSMAGRSSA